MTIKAKLTVQMTGQMTLPETQALLAAVIIAKITVITRTTLTRQAAHQTKIKSANNHHYFKSITSYIIRHIKISTLVHSHYYI